VNVGADFIQPQRDPEFTYPPDNFDYLLLRDGAVSLFYKPIVLQEAVSWFQERQYTVYILDAATWQEEMDFHNDVARSLNFPDYYGHNLNALNDCLTDMEVPDYSGMITVLLHFNAFLQRQPESAGVILDIFARASWYYLVEGKKFLTLVQSDDPTIQLQPVGCRSAIWNPREWFNKDRGL
jgi:RNAse (barnase) inhibitor barstar